MTRAIVAFGSNVDPERNVPQAVEALAARVRVLRVSPVYETPPVDAPGSPAFLNGVVEIETDLSVDALRRDVLRAVEAAAGRIRTADPNAPRPIDLDLVRFGEETLRGADSADHVAVPLADLLPDRSRPPGRPDFRRRPDLEAKLRGFVPDAGRPAPP